MMDAHKRNDTVDVAELTKLGVYDPAATDAEETLEYLEWLAHEGFDVVELARSTELAHFGAATAALSIRRNAVPLSEFSDLGCRPDEIASVAAAFGFSRTTLDTERYTSGEIELLTAALTSTEMFTEAETHYFAQIAAASLARLADATMSLFVVDVEAPARNSALTRTQDAQRTQQALALLSIVVDGLEPLFRLHMAQAIERLHWSSDVTSSPDAVRQAIGFVDLVGFSTLSENVSLADLSVVIREFETGAHDLVAAAGARVVKTIGDAVMFTAIEPQAVALAASSLIRELGSKSGVQASAGLAYGDVLTRGGDYYGPIVNAASRLSDIAVPSELLATPEFAESCGGEPEFQPAGLRQLKGFAAPIAAMSILT